jgi:hypothetical protein
MNKNIRHYIGDKVVALTNPATDISQFRVKGQIYEVMDAAYCPKCGKQAINIGQKTSLTKTICNTCGTLRDNYGLYWTGSELFVKVDDIEELLTEAINDEDYELASTLRDLKK